MNKIASEWRGYELIVLLVNTDWSIVLMTKTDPEVSPCPQTDAQRGKLALYRYLSHAENKFTTCHWETHTNFCGHVLQSAQWVSSCVAMPESKQCAVLSATLVTSQWNISIMSNLVRESCFKRLFKEVVLQRRFVVSQQQDVECLSAIVPKNRMWYDWCQGKHALMTLPTLTQAEQKIIYLNTLITLSYSLLLCLSSIQSLLVSVASFYWWKPKEKLDIYPYCQVFGSSTWWRTALQIPYTTNSITLVPIYIQKLSLKV